MKQIKITSKDGVTLHTANKYVDDDLSITLDESLFEGGGSSDRPYIPTPSEMQETETQDTIYMLYDASGYMCCPAFGIAFTSCVCTIQKYMNTTLVSESNIELINSKYTINYLQFSEEDEDYLTYNYIVIKMQGSITNHDLHSVQKFNGVEYKASELLGVSGKCASCEINVTSGNNNYKKLEYYLFSGTNTTYMGGMFQNCYSLQKVELDCSKVTYMSQMFQYCYSLKSVKLTDTSLVTTMKTMFQKCYSLQKVELDTSLVTDMGTMFQYCYSLKSVKLTDTSKVTDMVQMFRDCYSLEKLKLTDTSLVTNMSSTFYGCDILNKLDFINMKISFDLSPCKMLSQSELVKILNNLATVETTQTLTLGSTLLAKLTEDEIAIAQNKNWTLA